MVRWFRGLQFRLILGFTLALGLALASVGVYTGYAANREVEQFSERLEEARAARVEEMISLSYSQRRDWSGIQGIVERAGSLYGKRIVVRDAQGLLIADSQMEYGRLPLSLRSGDRYRPIRTGSEEIGFLTLAPGQLESELAEPAISRVVSAVNWSLVWAGLAAWIGGVLAGYDAFSSDSVAGEGVDGGGDKAGDGEPGRKGGGLVFGRDGAAWADIQHNGGPTTGGGATAGEANVGRGSRIANAVDERARLSWRRCGTVC